MHDKYQWNKINYKVMKWQGFTQNVKIYWTDRQGWQDKNDDKLKNY